MIHLFCVQSREKIRKMGLFLLNDFWNTATGYARAQHFAFSDAIGHPAYFVYSSATCCPFSVQNNIHTICSSNEHMIEFIVFCEQPARSVCFLRQGVSCSRKEEALFLNGKHSEQGISTIEPGGMSREY